MGSYSCAQSTHETLTASTVDTVSLTGGPWPSVEVLNRDSSAVIYFRVDGVAPVVGAQENYVVMAGTGLVVPITGTSVQLISSGTPAYSVTGLPS